MYRCKQDELSSLLVYYAMSTGKQSMTFWRHHSLTKKLYSFGSQHLVMSHRHHYQNLKSHTKILTDGINLLFSLMSRLLIHRMPCMHDSSTCAPWAPRLLQLMSSSISMVDSLQANPSSRFLGTTQCPPCISYMSEQ